MSPGPRDEYDDGRVPEPGQYGDSPPATDLARSPESTDILRRMREVVERAPSMPMSATVRVNRDELLDLIDAAIARMPDELRSARWLLKEREEFRSHARQDAEDIIEDAKARVAHMVQRTEVVKAAELRAQRIVEHAEAEARKMRRATEDYCDQKLASFEIVLERISKTVAAGREKLAAPSLEEAELGGREAEPEEPGGPAVFDQDDA